MSVSKKSTKLPLDTHQTVRDKEADERNEYQAVHKAYDKGQKSKSLDKKMAKARFDLLDELFEKKLKANPKGKAAKLAKVVRETDSVKSKTYPSQMPSMYSGEVIPYTNMGMICKLFEAVLGSFGMKGKLGKVGGIYFMHLLTEPEMTMNTLKNLMTYLLKNAPGDDSYVIIDNYMKMFLPVVQSLTGKMISKH